MDIEIKELKEERDTLKRRVDMERSAVAHALGTSQSDARSFRYDEWDYLNRTYLRAWCRVFEQSLENDSEEDITPLKILSGVMSSSLSFSSDCSKTRHHARK